MIHLTKKRLEIDSGLQLAYAEVRPVKPISGKTLLLVPGFTFSSEVFHYQLEMLVDEYHVIAIDPRSHGDSTITQTGNDYLTHTNDLQAFVEKLELDNIVLVGWSFGALATWGYSALDTERIVAHVCIDMPPVPLSVDEEKGAWVEGKISNIAETYHMLTSDEGQISLIKSYAQHVMVERKLTKSELDWLIDLSLHTPHSVAASIFASGVFSNRLEQAKMLDKKIPSLFYLANHWKVVAQNYISTELPNSSTIVFGGHMMFWEYPERFNRELKSFIESI